MQYYSVLVSDVQHSGISDELFPPCALAEIAGMYFVPVAAT